MIGQNLRYGGVMKKLRLFIVLYIIISCLGFVVACSSPQLASPSDLHVVDGETLMWNTVSNARGYTVSINGVETDTRRTSISLVDLEPGNYVIKVKARGDGDNYEDSAWVQIQYNREKNLGLKYSLINNNREYEITSIGSASGDIVLEDEHNGKPITHIGEGAFANAGAITSIVFGNNIKSVGSRAFYNCSFLSSISFSEALVEIGSQAFQSCRSLSELVIPNNVTIIDSEAFSYCRGLSKITLGSNLKVIGTKAFFSCELLESVSIPDTVYYLGEKAFAECGSIAEAEINGNQLTIGKNAFERCNNLRR